MADRQSGALTVRTAGLDRIDVFVNDRPRATADVIDGDNTVTPSPVPAPTDRIRIDGYNAGALAAACSLRA